MSLEAHRAHSGYPIQWHCKSELKIGQNINLKCCPKSPKSNFMTPFFRMYPLFYQKYGSMVIFKLGKLYLFYVFSYRFLSKKAKKYCNY